jgi:hypothetical protein
MNPLGQINVLLKKIKEDEEESHLKGKNKTINYGQGNFLPAFPRVHFQLIPDHLTELKKA